jgi:hypothetical protein
MLFEFKKSFSLMHITFSKILENVVNSETGLQLDMQDFSPFLYSGFTFEYLSLSGKIPKYVTYKHFL